MINKAFNFRALRRTMDRDPEPFGQVVFRFRLPTILLLRAEPGAWGRAPRDVRLDVAVDGRVEVSCRNGSESYARTRVLHTAAGFVRSIETNVPALSMGAELTPANGERPIRYSIVLGARVSIARAGEAPLLFGNQLALASP